MRSTIPKYWQAAIGATPTPFAGALVVLVLAILALACPKTPMNEQVLARVNDEKILVGDFRRELSRQKNQTDEFSPEVSQDDLTAKEKVLNQLIRYRLLVQEAHNKGFEVNARELEAHLSSVQQSFSGGEFRKMLMAMDLEESDWVRFEKERLLLQRLLDEEITKKAKVSPAEIENYYEAHMDEFKSPERVHARQIVLATEAEAQKILKELKKRKNRNHFEKFAKEHSLAPEAEKGGDVGFYSKGVLPEVFDVVFDLSVGRLSEVVESNYGFHIFQLIERQPESTRPLEEVRVEILGSIRQEKEAQLYERWVHQLVVQAKIKTNEKLLQKI